MKSHHYIKLLFAFLCTYSLSITPSQGQLTLYVDSAQIVSGNGSDWTSAFKYLHEAIDSAWKDNNVSTIRVAKGTYVPMEYPYLWDDTTMTGAPMTSTNNNRDKTFHIRQGLELYGGYPSGGGSRNIDLNNTTLSGLGVGGQPAEQAYHVAITDTLLNWSGGPEDTTKLDGFTITLGLANSHSTISINGTLFDRSVGGGVYVTNANMIFQYNTVKNNIASYHGGGYYGIRGRQVLMNNVITSNVAVNYNGGGWNCQDGHFTLTNNTIKDNSAGYSGGGYYGFDGVHNFSNNTFIGNTTSSGPGGGFSGRVGQFTATNNTFIDNTANVTGGAYDAAYDGLHRVINNTFVGNSAISGGGGLYGNFNSATILSNNLFWDNKVNDNATIDGADIQLSGGATFLVNHNLLQNDSATAYSGIILGAQNLYQLNPLFTDSSDVDGPDNIHRTLDDGLLPTSLSAAVNAGINDSIPAGVLTDIVGLARIQFSTVDMGAYENDEFPCGNQTVLYVDSSRVAQGDGESWATAFNHLSAALDLAWKCPGIDSILVAQGTYSPQTYPYQWDDLTMTGTPMTNTSDNRDKTFHIRQGLELYGGFPSGGGERNINTHHTVLTGAGAGGIESDSSYHVVIIDTLSLWPGGPGDTTVIDGLTINMGRADGSEYLIINNTSFSQSDGGGLYTHMATILVRNNVVSNNRALGIGGGCFSDRGNKTLINNTIIDNACGHLGAGLGMFYDQQYLINNTIAKNISANGGGGYYGISGNHVMVNNNFTANLTGFGGGAHFSNGGHFNLINNTFFANESADLCGGYMVSGGTHILSNNIFWENIENGSSTDAGADIFGDGSPSIFVNYNLLQNDSATSYSGIALGKNNLHQQNPHFVDSADIDGPDNQHRTMDDGLRLLWPSMAVNAGSNDSIPTDLVNDIIGTLRIQDGSVDLGAYEGATFHCGTSANIYVDSSQVTTGDGNSWATAFKYLQDALQSGCLDNGDTIRVAVGTYYPDEGFGRINNSRDATFNLPSDVVLIGGFANDGLTRDTSGLLTVLSGNIGLPELEEDNSYHTMIVDSNVSGIVLHSFTISSGQASGLATTDQQGAGLLCKGAVSGAHLIFSNNRSEGEGAAVYVQANGELSLRHSTIEKSNTSTSNIVISNELNSILNLNEDVLVK